MTSQLDVLPDVRPRFLTHPPRVASSGPDAVELAASAGLILDPWQAEVLEVALGERADGRWAARTVGLLVPRQNGKGAILEALELFALFVLGAEQPITIMHSAHQFKVSADAYKRIKGLIQQTPDLLRRVKGPVTSKGPAGFHSAHGQEAIELENGSELKFVARTSGGGRGFPVDLVVLDEAFNLTELAVSALQPTMATRPNPQTWFTSSAPLETEVSDVLRRVAKRGREGADLMAYMEFCGDSSSLDGLTGEEYEAQLAVLADDREQWAMGNPSDPHRIGDEAIEVERTSGMMTLKDFARERLGFWRDVEADAKQVIPAAEWAAACDPSSSIEGTPTFALEVAEDRMWAAFGAAGKAGARVHGECIDYRRGTSWVVARAAELVERHRGEIVVAKGSPAASMVKDLTAAKVPVREVSTEDHARACGQLLDAVADDRFRHLGQPMLNVAVRGAVKRQHGDAWVWSRRKSEVDISPLVAVTLAVGAYGAESKKDPEGFVMVLGGA